MKTTKLPNGGYLYKYDNGDKVWYLNDNLHREDGPAMEFIDGHKSWWINDELMPCKAQEEFERLMKLKAFW